MTGKGDRWGRNKVGRSEPAFLSASTIALPPSTCTARREAGQLCRRLLFFCEAVQLLAVVFETCAGRRVRRLCPPAAALFCGLCVCLPWKRQAYWSVPLCICIFIYLFIYLFMYVFICPEDLVTRLTSRSFDRSL